MDKSDREKDIDTFVICIIFLIIGSILAVFLPVIGGIIQHISAFFAILSGVSALQL